MARKLCKAISVALGGLLLFNSCKMIGNNKSGGSFGSSVQGPNYDHANLYTIGNRTVTDSVSAIDLSYASGSVTFLVHDENTILLSEDDDTLPEDLQVRSYVDGDILRIQFSAGGKRIPLDGHKKNLTVTLPSSIALHTLEVNLASADFFVRTDSVISVHDIDFDTASGDVFLKGIHADTYDISAASGNITIDDDTPVRSVEIETASGDVAVTASVSDEISADTASGNVRFQLLTVPRVCDIETASGDVSVFLPSDAAFTVKVETASGNFSSDFALVKNGNRYQSSNGIGCDIEIETASGDITLNQKES